MEYSTYGRHVAVDAWGIDCCTCGETVDPNTAIRHMIDFLHPKKTFEASITRGKGMLEVTSQ